RNGLIKAQHQPTMAKALCFVILALLCKLAVGTGRNLFSTSINGTAALQPSSTSAGICELLVTTQGYTCEEHTVTTSDGYILSLQRIPVGASGGSPGKRTPVLLQHGVLMDGMAWLLLPPKESLAFVLADNGYDVWIANGRGTKYSRSHVSLAANDKAYWDWSWDELATYDLPAMVDYVHNQTGQNMHYIGHSQGTLTALAAFSKGQLMNRLRSAALLCPISYLRNMRSILSVVIANIYLAEELHLLHLHEFDPKGLDAANLLPTICKIPGTNCGDLLTLITGQNCCIQPSTVDLFLKYQPQPSSMKNMIHFAQMARRGTLAMYDYDNEDENRSHYNGQPSPPDYNLTNIPADFPLFFSYGGNDALSDKRDVWNLMKVLLNGQNDSRLVTQYLENYGHTDFIMAKSAKEQVYDFVLSFMKLH
ncbi:Triacylglycerol lipase 2, partial [Linum grandiflorum]